MKWKLVADSGATISPGLFAGTDVAFELVPLMINIGTQVYVDDANLDMATFVKDMQDSKEASSTACPSPQAYANAFEEPKMSSALPSQVAYQVLIIAPSLVAIWLWKKTHWLISISLTACLLGQRTTS